VPLKERIDVREQIAHGTTHGLYSTLDLGLLRGDLAQEALAFLRQGGHMIRERIRVQLELHVPGGSS
jgi:hypothetical protein